MSNGNKISLNELINDYVNTQPQQTLSEAIESLRKTIEKSSVKDLMEKHYYSLSQSFNELQENRTSTVAIISNSVSMLFPNLSPVSEKLATKIYDTLIKANVYSVGAGVWFDYTPYIMDAFYKQLEKLNQKKTVELSPVNEYATKDDFEKLKNELFEKWETLSREKQTSDNGRVKDFAIGLGVNITYDVIKWIFLTLIFGLLLQVFIQIPEIDADQELDNFIYEIQDMQFNGGEQV